MDVQIMNWAMQKPEDWLIGGKCEAFLWGSGRNGQMCEGGRGAFVPVKVSSFSCSQQVHSYDCIFHTCFNKHYLMMLCMQLPEILHVKL